MMMLHAVNFAEEILCLRDQSYILTNDVLNKDDLNDLLSVVLCSSFFFLFTLHSFSALSYSLYRCVHCFSVFVLFVRMEIIIIIMKSSRNTMTGNEPQVKG